MKSSEILDQIQDILANSADIESFCQEKFSSSYKVYLGVDTDEAPGELESPCIAIVAMDRSDSGDGVVGNVYEVPISVIIKVIEDGAAKEPVTDGKKVTYEGLKWVEDFRELVEQELKQSKDIEASVDVSGGSITEARRPLYQSNTMISLNFGEHYDS